MNEIYQPEGHGWPHASTLAHFWSHGSREQIYVKSQVTMCTWLIEMRTEDLLLHKVPDIERIRKFGLPGLRGSTGSNPSEPPNHLDEP